MAAQPVGRGPLGCPAQPLRISESLPLSDPDNVMTLRQIHQSVAALLGSLRIRADGVYETTGVSAATMRRLRRATACLEHHSRQRD